MNKASFKLNYIKIFVLFDTIKMPAPGFFNRLKNILIKGMRWMNNNVVKPYAIPILNASQDVIPHGKQVANIVSKTS
jgi:hypothetical protein